MKDKTGRSAAVLLALLRGKIPRSKGKSGFERDADGGQFFAEVKLGAMKTYQRSSEYLAAVGRAAESRRSCQLQTTRKTFYSEMGLNQFWLKRK